ncbi:3-oxoacyl-ACP reductase [Kordiimonas sediminis]|uniref:3-oxoacyl-ACP reductase n=1 Tax=Kordiimonas sediminis TaxID=1735581 RepID=A0A919AUI6_9PROT|nr:SDR family oxidoreductase [Kordiimonas sediminis]GHF26777.1 3-oxoacyl-ACP reductase [Kordiimonas sediminis]
MDQVSLFDISGKVALVTGGGSGIGAMITETLVRAGCKVFIASRKIEACAKTAASLNDIGPGKVIPLQADLLTAAGTEALAEAVKKQTDRLDILVNNSGMTWGAKLEDFPRDKWDQVLTLNVTAVADLTRLLLPLLKTAGNKEDPARVINIGSVVGTRPMSNMAYSYAPSKAAVHHLTKMLSSELASQNILVNAIAPGPFESRMMAFVAENDALRKQQESAVPLGRFGRSDDITGMMLFLTSKASTYVTGAILPLDGGMSANP